MRKGASVDWKAPQSLRDSSPVGSAFHKKRVHPLSFGRSPTAADAVIRHDPHSVKRQFRQGRSPAGIANKKYYFR